MRPDDWRKSTNRMNDTNQTVHARRQPMHRREHRCRCGTLLPPASTVTGANGLETFSGECAGSSGKALVCRLGDLRPRRHQSAASTAVIARPSYE